MTEQELTNVIWDIKEIIRNLYDDAEVEDVILPFTLLRRLDCVLEDHRDAIMKEIKDLDDTKRKYKLKALLKQHGLAFFNTSGLSLELLLGSPEQIGDNFKTYLDGYTDNVKDILSNFVHTDNSSPDLSMIYSRLERHNKLFAVTQLFVQRADLHPDKVSNAMMGTVFENVLRRSKEASNTKAGQFYTPREVVQLLVQLTICGREATLFQPGRHFSIYDPCCGTGGMLTVGKEHIQYIANRKDMKVYLYGQELNEKTYAICKSDLLMKGDDQNLDEQIFRGDTLADDKLFNKRFDFMLANPPFGMDWGKDDTVKSAVLKENCKGGRFEAGIPSTSDGSLLFLLHMISKMDENNGSRIGIVLNGSPLFNGEAGSGWSNIRKMLLDRNLLDCIVRLPKNLFYGTDITTYLWVLDNKRPKDRENKVLFIDADHEEFKALLPTNLGKKRFEITEDGTDDIYSIYKKYESYTMDCANSDGEKEPVEIAKLIDYDEFLYTTVVVDRPLRLWFEEVSQKYVALCDDENFDPKSKKNAILKTVAGIDGINEKRSDSEFFAFLKKNGVKATKAEITYLRNTYGTISEDAPEVYVNPVKPQDGIAPDTNLRDSERIPFTRDIDDYFEEEVLAFVPDAWMDRTKDKVGCELPFTKKFYIYKPLRSSDKILSELKSLDEEMESELSELMEG